MSAKKCNKEEIGFSEKKQKKLWFLFAYYEVVSEMFKIRRFLLLYVYYFCYEDSLCLVSSNCTYCGF